MDRNKAALALLVPAAVLALQFGIFWLLPAFARPAAYIAMVATPLLAAATLVLRGRAESGSSRVGWFAIAVALVIWSFGAFGNLWNEWILGRANEIYRASMLAFYLAAVPTAFVLAGDWTIRSRAPARLADALVALVLGYAFFQYNWSMLTARGAPDEAGVVNVIWLLDVQNLFLTLGALIRWYASDDPRERKLFGTVALFQLVYQALLFYNNHYVAGDPAYGPQDSAVADISFGVIAACALYRGPFGLGWRADTRVRQLIRAASPLLLPGTLMLVSLALVRVDYWSGIVAILVAVAGYVMRTAQNQARYIERGDELQKERGELHLIALSDALTGLPNRRQLDQALETLTRGGQRLIKPVSVLMIDIDHFKALNDHYGHPTGDTCLKHVADRLRQAARSNDLVGRYGGEEFVALIEDADMAAATIVAEKMRKAVADLAIENAGSPWGIVTISVGTASAVRNQRVSGAELISLADAALYSAKRDGRNRTASTPPADELTKGNAPPNALKSVHGPL